LLHEQQKWVHTKEGMPMEKELYPTVEIVLFGEKIKAFTHLGCLCIFTPNEIRGKNARNLL
jgi:hypothetical protein